MTIPMISAATFVMEESKKLQGTLALARAKDLISKNEYEAAATFLLRIGDLCKAISEEKITMIDFYAESLDKLSHEKENEIENGLSKAATLNEIAFKNFFGWMEELEKVMI